MVFPLIPGSCHWHFPCVGLCCNRKALENGFQAFITQTHSSILPRAEVGDPPLQALAHLTPDPRTQAGSRPARTPPTHLHPWGRGIMSESSGGVMQCWMSGLEVDKSGDSDRLEMPGKFCECWTWSVCQPTLCTSKSEAASNTHTHTHTHTVQAVKFSKEKKTW